MWTIALIVAALTLFLLWRKKQFSYFKELGIPGPEPNLLFGNLLDFYRKDPIQCHQEWLDKYGKIVGYYSGTQPVVIITDVELLKKIQVSDFHNFMNRVGVLRVQSPVRDASKRVPGFSHHLIQLRDKRWKEIRSLLTPSFTTAKMKQMAPIINNAIDSLVKNIEKKSTNDESFDIYPMYQGLTMDVIGRTAFGIQTDVQNNPDDPFIRSARVLFSGNIHSVLLILAISFRGLEPFWMWLTRMKLRIENKGTNPTNSLIKSVQDVIAQRRKDKSSRRPDLLQTMLDAEIDVSSVSSDDLTATDDNDLKEKVIGSTSGKLQKMTDDDVLDNSVLFFLAGYETTSTALAFTTHMLLHHQDAQDKVREEVLQLIESEGELDYYSVSKLQYLDQVLHESLRIYPPIYLFINRECGEDIDYGKVKFKKGLTIQVPVFNLHRDPELWPEPEKFIPERFSPENKGKNHPMAFQPFGAGPRNCVGMRFALMEAKLALAQVLSKYKLQPCVDTDTEPISLKLSGAIVNPKKGVHLRAVPI